MGGCQIFWSEETPGMDTFLSFFTQVSVVILFRRAYKLKKFATYVRKSFLYYEVSVQRFAVYVIILL